MPVQPFLDWTQSGLHIAYRGSIEPQELTISAELTRGDNDRTIPVLVDGLREVVERGGAGGALFPPWSGRFEIVSGPQRPDFKGADKPKLAWVVTVQGVDPRFLRHVVELMAIHNTGKSLSIAGSLPPDGSDQSVTEGTMRAWLDDRTAYQGRWHPIEFAVEEKTVTKGCFVRVRTAGEISDAQFDELTHHYYCWHVVLSMYGSASGARLGINQPLGPSTRKKREVSFRRDVFDRVREPSMNALVNVLCRYHHSVAPIERVEIGLV